MDHCPECSKCGYRLGTAQYLVNPCLRCSKRFAYEFKKLINKEKRNIKK